MFRAQLASKTLENSEKSRVHDLFETKSLAEKSR